MQTVVFLLYHGMGHFNACIRIAQTLSATHNVIFAGVEYLTTYMKGQGFMFYPLKTVPFGMSFETWVNKKEKRKPHYIYDLKDRFTNRLFTLRETELKQLMHDLDPDYIFIDSYQATDFIILYPYLKERQVKTAFIQTMPPTVVQHNCPPLTSLALPDDKKEVSRAVRKFFINKMRNKVRQKLLYFGMDDDALVKQGIKRNNIPSTYQSSEVPIRGVTFQSIPEFVLIPKEFDFENNNKAPYRHYVGFMASQKRIEIIDKEYIKADQNIQRKLKNDNATLLYCSFGSVEADGADHTIRFIEKLIRVVTNTNFILVISIHSIHRVSNFKNIPDNVYIFKAVPQLEILTRASLFIMHGGLNSIKESIYAVVPMLAYPLKATSDMMGCSARIVYHKLGLLGSLEHDGEQLIKEKINELLTNKIYKDNITMLREIDASYIERFSMLFKTLQPLY